MWEKNEGGRILFTGTVYTFWDNSILMSTFLCNLCSYNGCLDIMLNLIREKPENYKIIVATHNEESVRRAVTR